MRFDYAPFYCEENILRLAAARAGRISREVRATTEATSGACISGSGASAPPASVIFISNEAQKVLLLHQKAGNGPLGMVVWDYHVVYEEEGRLFDLDTTLACPVDRQTWLEATFPASVLLSRSELAPRFAIVPAAEFVGVFSSDRRHMLTREGTFLQPPPEWPSPYVPERGHNLDAFVAAAHESIGRVVDLESMLQAWS